MNKDKLKKGFGLFLHKMKVMFRNIWKLIKRPFVKFFKKNKDNKLIIVIPASIVAILIIVLVAFMINGSSTSVVKKYAKGLVDYNVDKMYSVINSNYVKEVEESSSISVKEALQEQITALKYNKEDYVSYKIIDSYTLKDYEKKSVLDSMKIYARNMDESKIKEVRRYLIKFHKEVEGNTVYSYASIYAVKRGFTWSVAYNASI